MIGTDIIFSYIFLASIVIHYGYKIIALPANKAALFKSPVRY